MMIQCWLTKYNSICVKKEQVGIFLSNYGDNGPHVN